MSNFTQTVPNRDLSNKTLQKKNRSRLNKYIFKKWTKYIHSGELEILWPDGTKWSNKGNVSGIKASIVVNNSRFVRRCLFGGAIGFADSYIDGDWETPDLTKVISLGIANEAALLSPWTKYQPSLLLNKLKHALNANTYAGSKRNIANHYDLGNEFYQAWLDNSMTYSSGIFNNTHTTLAESQNEKYKQIAEITGINHGDNILEIGCGWGGFAEYVGKNLDVKLDCITISKKQYEFAKERIYKNHLNHKINIELKDYRDVNHKYNSIASIEMIEAVGHQFYESFFKVCQDRLKPEGAMLIQAITIADQHYAAARDSVDFIKRYIFPGSCIPSITALADAAKTSSDLKLFHLEDIGDHYATTLRKWRETFFDALPQVKELGFDDRFIKMWDFYLCYCIAGFVKRHISDVHMVMIRPDSKLNSPT